MPIVGAGDRVPAPVGGLEIAEDDAGPLVALWRVTPNVVVTLGAAGPRVPRALEPGVLIGGVVEDQLGDHPQPPSVRFLEEVLEVTQRSVRGMDIRVVGDIV